MPWSVSRTRWCSCERRLAAETAIARLHRVISVGDIATAVKTIDEVQSALQRDDLEVARIRLGDLRSLLARIRELTPTDKRPALQPSSRPFDWRTRP